MSQSAIRARVLVGAILIQLVLGTVYGYSIFWRPLDAQVFPPVVTEGRPQISDASALPTNIGTTGQQTYEAPYRADNGGVDAANPTSALCAVLDAQAEQGIEVLRTTTFTFGSQNHGAVVNVPYVVRHANTTRMTATFWLEKMHDTRSGQEFDQLQYRQTILLAFHHAPANPADDLIVWPHVTVNTLVKQ